jgi:hypothetical protein
MATEQQAHHGEDGRLDRRTRFREYMRRLDPTGDPAQAVRSGYYVAPPDAVSKRIATLVELEPASSHLLVGGVGSGKTTELIAIERKLSEVEDVRPVRVDVPSRHRLDKLRPGVLIALAASEAAAALSRERKQDAPVEEPLKEALTRISATAKGYWEDDWTNLHPGDSDAHWVPGILEEPEVSENVSVLSDALTLVHGALQRRLVILLDGLDRVADLGLVSSVLTQDVPAIGRAGVGLVVVGPQILRFSPHRHTESSFETVHLHGARAVDSVEGQSFLTAVLRARAGEGILPGDSAASLVRWSGGVLRDLIALARAAGAEAYAAASDVIQQAHVDIAADRFGRDLLLGCTKEMVTRLKDLAPKRTVPRSAPSPRGTALPEFTVATDIDQRLLLDRLIIEVPGTPVRYVPHPTVVPLIPGLGQ